PDRPAQRVGRIDRGADEARPDQLAVAPLVDALDDHGAAAMHFLEHPDAHRLEFLIGGEVDPRRLAMHLAGAVAEHLFHAAVAAHERAVLDEGDADHAAVEDELLLRIGTLERQLGLPAVRDVLQVPDRAALRIRRVHRRARDASPERLAIAPDDVGFVAVYLAPRDGFIGGEA